MSLKKGWRKTTTKVKQKKSCKIMSLLQPSDSDLERERALFLAAAVSRWFVRVVFGGVIACACEQQPDRSIDSCDGTRTDGEQKFA